MHETMHQILVAGGNLDILRQIVSILPADLYKPLVTRSDERLIQKLQGREVPVAILHESFYGPRTVEYCAYLRQQIPSIRTIYLRDASLENSVDPKELDLIQPDRTLTFPCPAPLLKRAVSALVDDGVGKISLAQQQEMVRSFQERLDYALQQNYYERLFCTPDAPHFALSQSFDAISSEFHPDRYRWLITLDPLGTDIYSIVNEYYRIVVEAWNVLKNRTTRQEYNKKMKLG